MVLEAFDDLENVGEATNGQEAIEKCETLLPDVALMDITMPVIDGIEATRRITAEHPQVRVLAYTSIDDPAVLERMLKAGAAECISKDTSVDNLVNALRRVAGS
jgi:DNA-binding NarL/FixJ family response regulator